MILMRKTQAYTVAVYLNHKTKYVQRENTKFNLVDPRSSPFPHEIRALLVLGGFDFLKATSHVQLR